MKFWISLLLMLSLSACNLVFVTEVNLPQTTPIVPTAPANTQITSDCVINSDHTMNVYDTPGNWGIITGRLSEGDKVVVLASSSNGWYRVEGVMPGWVAGNAAFPKGNCGSLPIVQAQPPLTNCQVTNTSGEAQILYASPQLSDVGFGGRFSANETLPVIRKEGDWYMVYVEAFSTGMWIQTSLVSASADCASLP